MTDIADNSTQEEDNLRNNNISSADNTDRSNDTDDETGHSLRNSSVTLETSNHRGRSRKRSSGRLKGKRRGFMRTKFEIESLYIEMSELKSQNEALKKIWENVQRQRTSQTKVSFSELHLELPTAQSSSITREQVPCTVQVSDASDAGHGSDLETSISDRDSEGEWRKGGSRKCNYTTTE